MNALNIKDLSVAATLDDKAMNKVHGGTGRGFSSYSSCFKMPSYEYCEPKPVSHSTTVDIAQANTQCQQNATGNGSAVFGGDICAWNNQQAGNYVGRY
ncbi:hypothetical protein [Noviherbaspirillum pedocola]|uniref:Uncharacterized protein n=1 Tax=Noviherbaspirillum pedocola TaxID=2801341 RepID=A0A934W7A2_9BURK|nr:hypothetical protein [Noviherbaspirillum pedocola]MBK4735313.1 hypothetical protein [Noviherbaspirillum pedocola]